MPITQDRLMAAVRQGALWRDYANELKSIVSRLMAQQLNPALHDPDIGFATLNAMLQSVPTPSDGTLEFETLNNKRNARQLEKAKRRQAHTRYVRQALLSEGAMPRHQAPPALAAPVPAPALVPPPEGRPVAAPVPVQSPPPESCPEPAYPVSRPPPGTKSLSEQLESIRARGLDVTLEDPDFSNGIF